MYDSGKTVEFVFWVCFGFVLGISLWEVHNFSFSLGKPYYIGTEKSWNKSSAEEMQQSISFEPVITIKYLRSGICLIPWQQEAKLLAPKICKTINERSFQKRMKQ